MLKPEWTYIETIQRRIRVNKINHKERHLDAQDIDAGIPFSLEAEGHLDLGRIKKLKIYRATIRVFSAELKGDLERQLTEFAIEDPRLRYNLQVIKRSGSKLRKFQLTSVE
jgi:hypothetical protein